MSHMKNGNTSRAVSNGTSKVLPEVSSKTETGRGVALMTTSTFTYDTIVESAEYLLERTSIRPVIGIICGSGMGTLADGLEEKDCFPYESIPNFPISTVEGHMGQLVFGYLQNIPIVCMQGRFHYYEGYPLWKCCIPVRVMKLLGVSHLIASNAAGALNEKFKVGDIMLIRDHVNLMGFAGNNPLQGPNDTKFGPRFPPMNNAYDRDIINVAKEIGKQLKMDKMLHEGVYTCVGGPNFETVAEHRMLKMVGIDAVGMSTVHEVVTARHCDMKVFAFSLITNKCTTEYESNEEVNHDGVMEVGKMANVTLAQFVAKLVDYLGKQIQQKRR